MISIDQRSEQAGAELRQLAGKRADGMGDARQVVAVAHRRVRMRSAVAVVGLVFLVSAIGWSLRARPGIVVDPVGGTTTIWTGATVKLPAGWQVAAETLMPNGPREQFVASTADLVVGGDRCAQTPEAALEQLGTTDALVVIQRLHPAQPTDPVLGTLPRWPDEALNQTTLRGCPSNGDQLDMYWFHARLQGAGYWVLGAFGSNVTEQRRAEALSILNSFQPANAGEGEAQGTVVVADVRGQTLNQARAMLERDGLEPALASGPDWQDPDSPDAVVVAQEPPAGATVVRETIVGLRTAEISQPLCDVLIQVPARGGDGIDLANADGYLSMLSDARPHAGAVLVEAIDQVFANHEPGQPFEQVPNRALDVVAIHHDACHLQR